MSKTDDIKSALNRFPVEQLFCVEHVQAALKKYYGHDSVSPITIKKVFTEMIMKGDLKLTSQGGPYPNLYLKPDAKTT